MGVQSNAPRRDTTHTPHQEDAVGIGSAQVPGVWGNLQVSEGSGDPQEEPCSRVFRRELRTPMPRLSSRVGEHRPQQTAVACSFREFSRRSIHLRVWIQASRFFRTSLSGTSPPSAIVPFGLDLHFVAASSSRRTRRRTSSSASSSCSMNDRRASFIIVW